MILASNLGFYSNQASELEGPEPRSLNWIILCFAILCIAFEVYYGIYWDIIDGASMRLIRVRV
jgi:hypothetical protein